MRRLHIIASSIYVVIVQLNDDVSGWAFARVELPKTVESQSRPVASVLCTVQHMSMSGPSLVKAMDITTITSNSDAAADCKEQTDHLPGVAACARTYASPETQTWTRLE